MPDPEKEDAPIEPAPKRLKREEGEDGGTEEKEEAKAASPSGSPDVKREESGVKRQDSAASGKTPENAAAEKEKQKPPSLYDASAILDLSPDLDRKTLAEWLGHSMRLKRLYRASVSGWEHEAFLRRCEDWPSTVVLAKASSGGQVFGGFSDKPWKRRHDFQGSESAFLFALSTQTPKEETKKEEGGGEEDGGGEEKGEGESPDAAAAAAAQKVKVEEGETSKEREEGEQTEKKEEESAAAAAAPPAAAAAAAAKKRGDSHSERCVPVRVPLNPLNSNTAICNRLDSLPAFGSAHDLFIAANANSNNLSYCMVGTTYKIPPAEKSSLPSPFLAGTFTFSLEELEVFAVLHKSEYFTFDTTRSFLENRRNQKLAAAAAASAAATPGSGLDTKVFIPSPAPTGSRSGVPPLLPILSVRPPPPTKEEEKG
uniref:TLDc domain-containing protein n=1 Tax=Chromera velia CCMP2878 TaxID=1169474 RepID=A0A0G4GUQ2_9ALVE|eukprot:Cvel_23462.t1-p1 / transcript=Cvel_23462.t1 / gene=Cvel_23462 / organism=Chromera_velia_CCMP2878 / gene_product=hypothetical protein / transcript_product=hypothetical protein / location=Cvel_scaffold2420:2112-3389(+) / protein_length=426 / sequence_SO=supercontig / SO=protein_coding / is_pseudo=false